MTESPTASTFPARFAPAAVRSSGRSAPARASGVAVTETPRAADAMPVRPGMLGRLAGTTATATASAASAAAAVEAAAKRAGRGSAGSSAARRREAAHAVLRKGVSM